MNSIPLQTAPLNVLNVFALRAFHPSLETGTLFGPSLERPADPDLPSGRLITDGKAAADLKLFSVLALVEAGEYARLCSRQGVEGPLRIPSPDQKGTPWFLEDYGRGDDPGSHGRTVFRTTGPTRLVEADLRTRLFYLYSFTIESPAARFTQSIRVNDDDDSVETDHFSAEVRGVKFENGLKMALGLSTAIYRSRQYDARNELGPLRFRQGEFGDWIEVSSKKRCFVTPVFDPESHAEIFLASSLSVFEDPSAPSRRPVVSLRLKPASLSTWDLEISLHRSPKSARRLMPLAEKLQKVLWNPIFYRIFGC
jgi:hypothetical protein